MCPEGENLDGQEEEGKKNPWETFKQKPGDRYTHAVFEITG